MAKKKVFLSLPMRGRTDEEIKADVKKMTSKLHADEEAVDNFITAPEDAGRLYCLGEAIKKLGDCDMIMLHPDWCKANGCIIEYYTARHYGIKIIQLYTTIGGRFIRRAESK